MTDFLTRLAERALGVTPVVQPLIASTFAPEQTEHQLDLQLDGEETATPGDSDRVRDYSAKRISSTRNAPRDPPQDATMNQQGNAGESHQEGQHRSRRNSESRPEPPHGPEPASAEREILVAQEDRQNSPSATNDRPQRAAGTRPESPRVAETGSLEPKTTRKDESRQNRSQDPSSRSHESPSRPAPPYLAESDPIQRDDAARLSPQTLHGASRSAPAATESSTVRAAPDRLKLLEQQVQGATLASGSTPNVPALLDAQEPMVESQTLWDELALPDAPLVKPEMVRSQLDEDVRRVPPGPHRLAPEPHGPTVRVNIGRIEVRAITPSPPPVPRPASALPGPVLSLDAYLKQRNEGQR
jgi:hypothetical protein